MFDYFFKRSTNQSVSAPTEAREVAVEQSPKDTRDTKDKEIALQKAEALSGDELAAVEFILQCQFADARLIAAEQIHSRDMLERVLPPMRKADRRVAKMMQARLDAMAAARQHEQQAQQCLATAQKLLAESMLLPNQVADLDRAWQLAGTPSQAAAQAFDEARSALRARLEAQAQLQRTVIDHVAALRDLANHASGMSQADVGAALQRIEQEMEAAKASPDASSLPKNLFADFSAQRREFQLVLDSFAEIQHAMRARLDLLQRWEESDQELRADALQSAWSALPPLPDDAAADDLQSRFTQLLQRAAASVQQAEKPKAAKDKGRAAKVDIADTLEAIDKALQEGAVRVAVDLDRQLRAKEGLRLSQEQNAQLTKLRHDLNHLQGWAKWGGNVSREELLRAAEELPAKSLAPTELAKKVGSLRDRWKSLDVSAGPAAKDLWERFDAACTLAYAPAAAHFKKLSDERQANMRKAEGLVAEIHQFVAAANCSGENAANADWKAIAAFCTRTEQAWHKLGGMDRKEKKRLDAECQQSLQLLKAPLSQQQQAEISVREHLIAETLALNPTDRTALDTVRILQERWQQRAKALPLERKHEQALWQKFRSACDGLFAKRKEAAAGADADRKRHLTEKEALCQKLDAAQNEPASVIAATMREVKDAWTKVGPVPRAQESQIENRLHAALVTLQAQIDNAKRIAAENEKHALLNKVRLCMSVEKALAAQSDAAPASAEHWQALPALSADIERILRARFDQGLQALQSSDAAYRASLETNRHPLLQSLLRLEILCGLDSPAELSRERLQMQVEVLQSTLKSGAVTNKREMLKDLCKVPAAVDQQSARRIELLIGRLNSVA